MKNIKTRGLITFLLLFLYSLPAMSVEDPDTLVKNTVDDILKTLREDSEASAGNVTRVREILEEKAAPHIDFERITRIAVGRSWRTATPEQKESLIMELRELIMRIFAAGFKSPQAIVVETKPLPRLKAEVKEAQVTTVVRRPGGAPPLTVIYTLAKSKGIWKMLDVTAEGQSLVINFRSEFAREIQKGGVEGLVNFLSMKNDSKDNID